MLPSNDRLAAPLEYGGSAVVAVVSLPLLLLFLFAAVDLGRLVFFHAEVDTAAHAVCQYAKAFEGVEVSEDEVRRIALEASPALAGAGISFVSEVRLSDASEVPYERWVFDSGQKQFFQEPTHAEVRRLEVEFEVKGGYLTPLGTLLGAGAGANDMTFSCKAFAHATVDM